MPYPKHGGLRNPKGGRPENESTKVARALKNAIARRVGRKAWRYLNAMEDLALGHLVEEVNENGQVTRKYRKSPDREALKDVMERVMGKPTQMFDTEDGSQAVFVIMRGGQEIEADEQELLEGPDDDVIVEEPIDVIAEVKDEEYEKNRGNEENTFNGEEQDQ